MNSGRVDRKAVMASLRRLGSDAATAAKTAVNATHAPERTSAPRDPAGQFGDRAKVIPNRGSEGQAVSASASADQLWGQNQPVVDGERPPLGVQRLRNLTPAEATAKLAKLEQRKAELERDIVGRVGELDERWKHSGLDTRIKVLKEYVGPAAELPQAQAQELAATVGAAYEGATENLNQLRKDAKVLHETPKQRAARTPEQQAKRDEMAQQLLAARAERHEVVEKATELVDAAGLKVDRLLVAEEQIDPHGGSKSKFGVLAALVKEFFSTVFFINTINLICFDPMQAVRRSTQEEAEAERRRLIEDNWRNRDGMIRNEMRSLSDRLTRRRGQARPLPPASALDAARTAQGARKS